MVETRRRLFSMDRHALFAVLILGLAGTGRAAAQSYDAMSCDELWYARNAIYGAKGYCFKTARARQVFGPGCVPPYGELTPAEENQVNLIQQVEAAKGCSGGGSPAPQPIPPPDGYAQMSCDQLWYERNAIYAANGYCFKTARARQVFGPGCVPPYGNLNAHERGRVSTIQQWERSKGCQ